MELLNTVAAFISKLFQWWFTVMPWEQALLIRRGKMVKLLGAGMYFKIPFIDTIYIQTTRMRMVDTPMQTISTKDGATLSIKLALGYTIENILTLYNKLYHPEMTLNSMAMGHVGEFVRSNDLTDITPIKIEQFVNEKIDAGACGLKDLNVKITTFASVRTYRFIQDSSNLYEGLNMEQKK